jgi:nitric oxide reductase NorE protein
MNKASALEELPGDLMMWVLIVSELLVFGAGLAAFLSVRISDPSGFSASQDTLHRTAAGLNTLVLVTSGFLAAVAVRRAALDDRTGTRLALAGAALLGVIFLGVKGYEYADEFARGVSFETHPFYMFYFLLTGFHAAHVVAGIVILMLVGWQASARSVEVGAAFWHMVDLVWVLLFPVIYLLR